MIRIKELFRLQGLKRLRLIAGQEGLESTVTAAVLLEYDSSRMQLPDFYRGDLVVTTLAYARGDQQLVAQSLSALLNQGIAGLLVKTAYFSELPMAVVQQADKLGTPLFLFDDTYIEEVILEVTELIRGRRYFAGYEKELDALMQGGLSGEQTAEYMRRIDPSGSGLYRLCALYPRERIIVLEEKLHALLTQDERLAQRCICMEWGRMLIMLLRVDDAQGDGCREAEDLLARAGVQMTGLHAGVSAAKAAPEMLGEALHEAVYASRAARMTDRELLGADQIGLYAYLLPMSENAFVCAQCRRQIQRIREYDAQNRTSLEQTARAYVDMKLEIAATAKVLFQHPNTVRYRLAKVQKLMDIDDDALFAPMLSLMIHLLRILESEAHA